MKGKKYTAIEIVSEAFPEGVDVIVGEEPHIVTAEDVASNPGVQEMKEGDEIMLPVFEKISAEDAFGKFGINIGGISGIVNPGHKIMVSEGADQLTVTVGKYSSEVSLEYFVEELHQPEVPAEPVAEPTAPAPEA